MKTKLFAFVSIVAVSLFLTACFYPSQEGSSKGAGSYNSSSKVFSAKPDSDDIQKDLVGHSLSEGYDNGYYPSYWKWKIESGEISNFRIISIDKDTPDDYELTATMRLTSISGKAFDAKVKVLYVSNGNYGWRMEYVQSLGMNIVKTGRYDSCITSKYDDWHEATFIYNNCEIPIEVGGVRLAWVTAGRQEPVHFSEVISPHSSVKVFDLISIDYQEVP